MSTKYYENMWDKRFLYKKASDFLKKYNYIPEVEEIKTKLNKDYVIYRDEIEKFLNKALPVIEELDKEEHTIWKTVELLKKLVVPFIALFLLSGFLETKDPFRTSILFTLFKLIIMLGIPSIVIGILYFKIKEKAFYKKRSSILAEYESEARRINSRTAWIQSIYDKVDDLYLDTLDPAHREAVLMRREQERQHRELMDAQQRHNQAMLDEQRRILQAQEEMLQIEREREERYKRNSY